MKVSHCAQIFSRSVAVAINILATSGWSIEIEGNKYSLTPEAVHTAQLCEFLDDMFDSMNGNLLHPLTGKQLRSAVKDGSPHFAFWNTAIKTLETMKFITNKGPMVPPTVKNCIYTIKILYSMLQKFGLKYMMPRRFNQDPIENVFGRIRQRGARYNSPSCGTFTPFYKSLLVNSFTSSHSIGMNCEDDKSQIFITLLNLVTQWPEAKTGRTSKGALPKGLRVQRSTAKRSPRPKEHCPKGLSRPRSTGKRSPRQKEHCQKVSTSKGALPKGLHVQRSTVQKVSTSKEHCQKVSHVQGALSRRSPIVAQGALPRRSPIVAQGALSKGLPRPRSTVQKVSQRQKEHCQKVSASKGALPKGLHVQRSTVQKVSHVQGALAKGLHVKRSTAKRSPRPKEHCQKVSTSKGALSKRSPRPRSTAKRSPTSKEHCPEGLPLLPKEHCPEGLPLLPKEHCPKVSHVQGALSRRSPTGKKPIRRKRHMEYVGLGLGLTSVAIAFWFLFRHYWQKRTTEPVTEEVELEDRTNFAQEIFRQDQGIDAW
ncbi:hypothetical protein QE152_g18091 [Popillia japonica]|uniref:Transposable element P transposase-like RNase H C-terminal domain-containing protein n=1 Tax=Popillia japonica TaxID=7064 RepID=A0AAW1L0N9_POPJA